MVACTRHLEVGRQSRRGRVYQKHRHQYYGQSRTVRAHGRHAQYHVGVCTGRLAVGTRSRTWCIKNTDTCLNRAAQGASKHRYQSEQSRSGSMYDISLAVGAQNRTMCITDIDSMCSIPGCMHKTPRGESTNQNRAHRSHQYLWVHCTGRSGVGAQSRTMCNTTHIPAP